MQEREMTEIMNLNFHPYYADLLTDRKKTTTLRLDDETNKYHVGDDVDITISWDSTKGTVKVASGKIMLVGRKPINKLTKSDLEGESPDCQSVSAVKYVLSAIYRRIARDEDLVTIIKWRYT